MPEPSIDFGDIPAWLALVFSLVSLIWQGVAAFFSRREKRVGRTKTQIEQLIVDIDGLCEMCISYWMKPEDQTSPEGFFIVARVRDLSSKMNSYRGILWDRVPSDFSDIKRKITGGDFQVAGRQALGCDNSFIKDFVNDFSEFKEKLRLKADALES